LDNVAELGVTDEVVPCVDQSSLATQQAVNRFVKQLTPCVRIAEKK